MATSALGIYNKALRYIGERRLASLVETREPRYALDDEFPDTVLYALEDGYWTFATRAAEVYAETSLTPFFGFAFAFAKPADWLRTYQVSLSPFFDMLLNDYKDESGFWYAQFNPIFVKFISNDPTYGLNVGLWPQAFSEYVAGLLASRISYRLTQKRDLSQDLMKVVAKLRDDALAKDAMNNGPDSRPIGSWVRSRRGRTGFLPQDKIFSSLMGG